MTLRIYLEVFLKWLKTFLNKIFLGSKTLQNALQALLQYSLAFLLIDTKNIFTKNIFNHFKIIILDFSWLVGLSPRIFIWQQTWTINIPQIRRRIVIRHYKLKFATLSLDYVITRQMPAMTWLMYNSGAMNSLVGGLN